MSRVLVLDAEALSSLARQRGPHFREVRAAIEAARRLKREVITPAVILAELYRGRGHNQIVDACMSRESFIGVRDTDREFARYVGGILLQLRPIPTTSPTLTLSLWLSKQVGELS